MNGSVVGPVVVFCLSVIAEPREEMDGKSGMERLVRDEGELDGWYYKEDKKGKVHV